MPGMLHGRWAMRIGCPPVQRYEFSKPNPFRRLDRRRRGKINADEGL